MKAVLLAALLAVLSAGLSAPVAAQADYPTRSIQIVVPYSANGGTDRSTRVLAKYLSPVLGVDVVVRNVVGDGGANGIRAVVTARPDGYFLGIAAQGPLAMVPHYRDVGYTIEDPDYLALFGRTLMMLAVHRDKPYKTMEEFIAYAREHPGSITVGNSGKGGAVQIATEGFSSAAGISVSSVPYAGSAASIKALIKGDLDAVVASPAELQDAIADRMVVPLMVMEDRRLAQFSKVPTARDLGIDFVWASWKGVIAPQGLPKDVRVKLISALESVMLNQDFLRDMRKLGEVVDYRPSVVFEDTVRHDSDIAETVIRFLKQREAGPGKHSP